MEKGFVFVIALCATGAFAKPETLRFDGAAGEFYVKVDYDRAPDRNPPSGTQWSDFEQDSSWTETANGFATYHVRYSHAFYVSQGGHSGVGFDRLVYDGPKTAGGRPDAADASFSFLFLDGAQQTVYSSLTRHYLPRTDLDPPLGLGFEIGDPLSVQAFENFLPTGSEQAVIRARSEGFDARLGPGPFRGRLAYRK